MTGAAGTLWGPIVKERFDRRQKAAEVRDRYSPPLLQAAYDLQSRLYNIVRQGFLQAYMRDDEELRRYAECSTLWLLGQYLGWAEILRREVQFLDFGTHGKNRELQEALGKIAGELARDAYGRRFAVFRASQRAIGELMIGEGDESDTSKRTASLGYAEFVPRLEEPSFGHWFSRLREDLDAISTERDYARFIRVQRALVDLVDVLDPERVRYPVPDFRGRLPLPAGEPAEQHPSGCPRIARFVARGSEYDEEEESFPGLLLDAWSKRHLLDRRSTTGLNWWSYEGKDRRLTPHLILHAIYKSPRFELYAAAAPPRWARAVGFARSNLSLDADGWRFRRSRKREKTIANDLLLRLGRPAVR